MSSPQHWRESIFERAALATALANCSKTRTHFLTAACLDAPFLLIIKLIVLLL